jgi:predicted N-formylglutamate amidohydrolase
VKPIFSCEHAGNKVPENFKSLFSGREEVLSTHRAFDPGALAIALKAAELFQIPLFEGKITRLLVDLNRSPGHKDLFSEFSRDLDNSSKKSLLTDYYYPYREKIEEKIQMETEKGNRVFHLSFHSFVPVLNGETRNADAGLLYDPGRKTEKEIALYWKELLKKKYRVRFNYPYLGKSDGLVTHFRKIFPGEQYIGMELEINQKFFFRKTWDSFWEDVIHSLNNLFGNLGAEVPGLR